MSNIGEDYVVKKKIWNGIEQKNDQHKKTSDTSAYEMNIIKKQEAA